MFFRQKKNVWRTIVYPSARLWGRAWRCPKCPSPSFASWPCAGCVQKIWNQKENARFLCIFSLSRSFRLCPMGKSNVLHLNFPSSILMKTATFMTHSFRWNIWILVNKRLIYFYLTSSFSGLFTSGFLTFNIFNSFSLLFCI